MYIPKLCGGLGRTDTFCPSYAPKEYPMLDKEIVGKNIANYRKRKDITQKELARLLNITAQSVSKWEAGLSLPTVDMIYDVAQVLGVSVDSLLNDTASDNRDICYEDTGLDVRSLYRLKSKIDTFVTDDENVLYAHYVDPVIFKMDIADMEEPVFAMTTNVPGSKARLARERGYDKEICIDVAVRAINHVIRYGFTPKLMRAQVVCGSKDVNQLEEMALSFKEICEANGVIFAGMEISGQPINYRANEYEVNVSLVAVADKKDIIHGQAITEGDVVIGLMTEGIEANCYPFIQVMLDRKPELAYEKIDDEHYFVEEILRPNTAFTHAISELKKEGILHGACRTENSFLGEGPYVIEIPDGLGFCIDMAAIPLTPLYKFLLEQDMVGKNFFPHRFSMGVGMLVIVSKRSAKRAMEIIRKYHEAYILGRIEQNDSHNGEKVWTEGKVKW